MYVMHSATEADTPTLLAFREAMYQSMHPDLDVSHLRSTWEEFFRVGLKDDSLHAWIIESDCGEIVASIVARIYELVPTPENPGGRHVYAFNLYTEPRHRRKGLAGQLLEAVGEFGRARGISSVTLHASEMGKPVFIKRGFRESNEMTLIL